MSREFGLSNVGADANLWIGCRAIITNRKVDIPWDRWSTDIKCNNDKDDFVWWINNIAIPKIEMFVKEGKTKFQFYSESNFFTCEVDDRNSGGYLYIAFYSTKTYDKGENIQ